MRTKERKEIDKLVMAYAENGTRILLQLYLNLSSFSLYLFLSLLLLSLFIVSSMLIMRRAQEF